MNARRIGLLFIAATMAGSGLYLFLYLYRWEWNRALTAGVFFIAAEVALVAFLIVERLRRLEGRLAVTGPVARTGNRTVTHQRALTRLHAAAPAPRDHFAWLRPQPDRMGVFVPVLMGAGFVLSGLAWLVERVARATARPALERGLARRMTPLLLTMPADGLVSQSAGAPAGRADLLLLRPAERWAES